MEFPITIAYNMEERKVGCVLVQPMLGATCPSGAVSFHFDTDKWELNPTKCKLYALRSQEEFDAVVEFTHRERIHRDL